MSRGPHGHANRGEGGGRQFHAQQESGSAPRDANMTPERFNQHGQQEKAGPKKELRSDDRKQKDSIPLAREKGNQHEHTPGKHTVARAPTHCP